MNGKTFIAILFAAAIVIAGIMGINDSNKKADLAVPETEEVVKFYDDVADYYLDIIIRMEKSLTDTELPFYLGSDLENYTVDADSTVQRHIDEILWRFCLRTSDEFARVCDYMNDKRDYRDEMFNVLNNIVYRQDLYVQKYGSDLMKKDAVNNTYRFEEEKLTGVVNQTLYKENRLLAALNEIKQKYQ